MSRSKTRLWLFLLVCSGTSKALCRGLLGESYQTVAESGSPHRNRFGEAVADEECAARDSAAELKEITNGAKLPYVFTGPDAECTALGCLHNYWGSRARFDGQFSPACPIEDRWEMTNWLSQHAQSGSQWAKDVLTFKPCDLWAQLRGRTTWVIGDSISQDLAYALASFLVEYFQDSGRDVASDPTTMRSLTHSVNGHELSTWCFHMILDTRICSLRANKAPRLSSTVLRLLPTFADREKDIVVMNFGTWYNWVNEGMSELEADMPQFEEVLRSLIPTLPLRLLWRESTAQHYNTSSGMFDNLKAIPEQRCAPPGSNLTVQVEMHPDGSLAKAAGSGDPTNQTEFEILLAGGHRNRITQPAIDRLGIETLRIWNISLAVHDVHKHYHRPDSGGECVTVECDCSHACLPSWYQMVLPSFSQLLRRWDEQNDDASQNWAADASR